MRHYQCRCGNALFFDNSLCLKCGHEIGYDPAGDQMLVLEDACGFQRCRNGSRYAACNWLVSSSAGEELCCSCRLNRTIPDLTIPANLAAWRKIEGAKRRTLYTLARLGLRPISKADDPIKGLTFDFLRPLPGKPVMTGHEDGVITLNVEEAEDSVRERQRELMGEPWRTLIGHFRHEAAHYYWDLFFQDRKEDDPWMMAFRQMFGDEREDYGMALARYYQASRHEQGDYISVYAMAHPWEDWAEIWAHYLHMMDGIETAACFRFDSRAVPIPFTPFPSEAASLPGRFKWSKGEGRRFLSKLHDWAKLAPALNELGASLGHAAFYPFVFSQTTIRKLCFVHYVVQSLGSTVPSVTLPPPADPCEPLSAAA